MMGLTQVPLVGFLLILSVPAFSAGMLQAIPRHAEGGRPAPALLLSPCYPVAILVDCCHWAALMFVVGILTASLFLSGSEVVFDPDLLARIERGEIEALSALDQDTLHRLVIAFVIDIGQRHPELYDHSIDLVFMTGNWVRRWQVASGRCSPTGNLSWCLLWPWLPCWCRCGACRDTDQLCGRIGVLSVILLGLVMILLLAFQLILFATQYCAFGDIFGLGKRVGATCGDR